MYKVTEQILYNLYLENKVNIKDFSNPQQKEIIDAIYRNIKSDDILLFAHKAYSPYTMFLIKSCLIEKYPISLILQDVDCSVINEVLMQQIFKQFQIGETVSNIKKKFLLGGKNERFS